MTPIKVFGIFLSIIFLLSCTITPKKIDKDLAIQRIDIYPISSTDTFEEINVTQKMDSTVMRIDLIKDSLYWMEYRSDSITKNYKLIRLSKWKNKSIYKPSIFNHIPSKYIEKNRKYIFSKTPEKNWRSVAFHFTDGTETHWAFKYDIFVTQYKNQLSYDELIKQSQYPEIEPFYIILQDLGYYIWGLKWDFVPDFPFEKNDINREIIKRYEQ